MKRVIKFVTGKRDERQEDVRSSANYKELNFTKNLEKGGILELDNFPDNIMNYFEKDKNLTKLHKAAWHGNLEKLKSALKKTEIDAIDSRQRTALHYAVVQGHPNIVWFLLENNAKTTICDYEGRTPLLKAIEFGHKECISLLLERGANINDADYKGNTGLHIAITKGSVELVASLLKKGADTELSNKDGEYVLHTVIKLENEKLLNLLLNSKARVDVLDRNNRTPLMLAAKAGNLILTNILIEFGAQLILMDSHGKTAEDFALLAGHKEIALLLKTFFAKRNKFLDTKKECNKFKNNSLNESCAKETENLKTREKKQEKGEARNFLMSKPKKKDEKSDNKTDGKNCVPESPESHFVPPLCQSPRSWNFIQASMINRIPKPIDLKMPVLNFESEPCFVEKETFNNKLKLSPEYTTLSLDRRKKIKFNNFFLKRRFSLDGKEELQSLIKTNETVKADLNKGKIGHTWMHFNSGKPSMQNLTERVKFMVDEPFYKSGETLLPNNKKCNSTSNSVYSSTDYDEISSSKNCSSTCKKVSDSKLAPYVIFSKPLNEGSPPTQVFTLKTESTESLSVNSVTKQSSSVIYIDNKSLNALPKKSFKKMLKTKTFQNWETKETIFSPTSENQAKEISNQEIKKKKLLKINKKINKQLDCYDKALKELAEFSPTKRYSELHKRHSFLSSKTRYRKENFDAKDKSLLNSSILSFPSFDKHTLLSFINSNDILLKAEKQNLKSSPGEFWQIPLIGFPFLGVEKEKTEEEKQNKSIDFTLENDLILRPQEITWEKDVRVNNKTYDSDEDISEIPKEQIKNKETTPPFSPLGVIFKEIQIENQVLNFRRSPIDNDIVRTQKQDLENTNSKSRFYNEEEDETNQDIIQSQSSNISFSSGSVELLGLEKDSGSEPESSHKEITPIHDYPVKIHQDLLRCNLKITTSEKIHLEELIAKMSEKSERLQYELADAKEVTRIRDEVIKLLQYQLARMEAAYTKSLEESMYSKLQLTSHEQEILHLKKMCYKYEEEKNKIAAEVDSKNMDKLILQIKKLVSEKEKLKEEILQLEKEKLSLTNYLKDVRETRDENTCQDWKEGYEEDQIGNTTKCIEDVKGAIQKIKKNNCKTGETIYGINAENLEDLSKFEILSFKSNLKTKSTHWYIGDLRNNNFTFANYEKLNEKQNAEYFDEKETQFLSNQCEIEKELPGGNSRKKIIFFDEIVKENTKKISEKYKGENTHCRTINNQICEINLELGKKKILESKLVLLKSKSNRDFVKKCNIELISYQRELEKKKNSYLKSVRKCCAPKSFKVNCEKLAKEKERSSQIKNKFWKNRVLFL